MATTTPGAVGAVGAVARTTTPRAVTRCVTSAPPKPRTWTGSERETMCGPARVSAAQRRKPRGRRSRDEAGDATDDGNGDDGGDWFGGGGGGGGGEGGGDDGEDEDAFRMDADELTAFERAFFSEMEVMDAHALYAWQSACAVTLVGCVQHVIDVAAARARGFGDAVAFA